LLPGIAFISTPEVVRNLYDYNGNIRKQIYFFKEQRAIQLALKFGIGFRYQINKRYFFSLNTDYYYCNARFDNGDFPERKLLIEQLYVLLGIEYVFNN